jgi:hypothetical protein
MSPHSSNCAIHSTPPQVFPQMSLDQGFQHYAQRIQGGTHPDENQAHRENLTICTQWAYLAEPDGSNRCDRLICGVEQAEAEQHVSAGTRHQHRSERQCRKTNPPHGAHAPIVVEAGRLR